MHSVLKLTIYLLRCDVTFVYVCILPFGGHHFECIVVIERKVLIVSLFANASDYSNETCIFCIQAHRPVNASPVGVVTCVGEEQCD